MGIFDFLKRGPRKKTCARCGQRAAHGYSRAAESDPSGITPLCMRCLSDQLDYDFAEFHGRAIVIAPSKGLPCYIFRNREVLRSISVKAERELDDLLETIGNCSECETPGCCLWTESRGVSLKTFRDVLEKGLFTTVLLWGNPAPRSLCAKCTGKRIIASLQTDGFEFFEICSPHGESAGIVMPMAY